MRIFIFIVTLLILFSCKKETPEYPKPLPDYRTIKVSVKHVYQILPEIKDSAVPGANIRLFISKEDMIDSTNAVSDRYTDSNGVAWIQYLKEDFYYLKAYHPKFYMEADSVSTPAGTVSFVEILYY